MKRVVLLGIAGLAATVMAGKIIITSYSVPHEYPLAANSEVQIDPSGLFITVSDKAVAPSMINRYFLGNSNSLKFDTASYRAKLNFKNGAAPLELAGIDSLVTFAPPADSSGDKDGDGLSNFDELMVYHTDPTHADTDGDGLSDGFEAGRFNPLVADLPRFSISMQPPQMYALVSKQSSTTTEEAITTSSSWGTDEGSSSSTASTNELTHGWNVSAAYEYSFKEGAKLALGFGYNGQYAVSTERAISTDRRKTYNDGVESLKSRSTTEGFEISGGKLSVVLGIKNISDIGFSLSNLTYNLYGIKYLNGKTVETLISTLPAALADLNFSLAPGLSNTFKLLDVGITNPEMDEFGTYHEFKAEIGGYNAVFNPSSAQELKTSDVLSTVNASCVRVEVDFDDNGKTKESPLIRYVATKTKWIEETKSYGPTYLGEVLHAMGLSYTTKSPDGFDSILDVAKDDTHQWRVAHSKRGVAGTKSDTLYSLTGAFSSPDSVLVNAGDAIVLYYTGDKDNDGVPDYVERRCGTYALNIADSDGDGLSDFLEIFGHKVSNDETAATTDSITVTSHPLKKDSDLDGESDLTDHSPLSANKDPGGKLLSIEFQREEKNLTMYSTDFKTFNTALKARIADKSDSALGTLIRFRVKLDGDPKVAEVLVNGTSNFKLIRDKANLYEYYYDAVIRPGFDSTYTFNKTNTVCVHLVSADEKYDSTYCVLGKTSVGTPNKFRMSTATLDNRKPWKILHPSVNIKAQLAVDPRITGILVYRVKVASNIATDTGSSISFPALPVQSRFLPDFGEIMNVEEINLVGILGEQELAGDIFDMSDSFNILAGANYSYFTVPFAKSNTDYFFGKPSQRSLSTQTSRIYIKAMTPGWWCLNENDGTGSAEIRQFLAYSKRIRNKAWIDTSRQTDDNDVVDGEIGTDTISFIDSAWQETDSIRVYMKLEEVDPAGDPNDVILDAALITMQVNDLLTLTDISSSENTGYIFKPGVIGNTTMPEGPNFPYPTRSKPNRINWWGDYQNDAHMNMKFNLSWYIK